MIFKRDYEWPDWDFKSPFEELERMKRRMERLFQGFPSLPWRESPAGVFPLINITEDKDNFYARAEIPGTKSDDLEISVTGTNLTIAGERKVPEVNEKARYHRREIEAGRFSRAISLPAAIEANKVEAHVSDGVLTVILPKAETAKPKQIAVKAS
jgi:HSP20 family protein